ncbi:OsmC family protein [Pseudodesulfovibrio piezophilus]|uniref:OsmC family protein n=1 Tax=Pseudodesulfovibrio piezophilus (strain DSM 21447 / JCM 15486 / C1TLV30) TaxID=1322246 RepID=M1WU89_PSEP2|nr:OsmC family protein [Pseudodesulfovibrio piezophilus]CCH50372.1 OsmC family protein [Pseudodesulfovibrio piezophilus C1TLV30]
MDQKVIDIVFKGNVKINAEIDGLSIATDQPTDKGGEGTAPNPFQLFLASLSTCAGFYAIKFCQTRELNHEGLGIRVLCDFADKGFKVEKMTYEITLPEGFPEKYRPALIRAVDQCTVKKHVCDCLDFEIIAN